MSNMTLRKLSHVFYAILLAFRVFVCPFLKGYVHPDEFFQGGQELWFGCPPTIPWEFDPSNALRSIIPPTLVTWLPLKLYSWLKILATSWYGVEGKSVCMGTLSGLEVLVVPRIACSILSVLTIDWTVWRIHNNLRKQQKMMSSGGVPIPVLLLASAWPTLVMLTRPFSNTIETFMLGLLMILVCTIEVDDKHKFSSKSSIDLIFCFKLGVVCALGIFTRFTFVFFAFPVLMLLLNYLVQNYGVRNLTMWKKLGLMTLPFALVAIGIIFADTSFYFSRVSDGITDLSAHTATISSFGTRPFVLTPFNLLAYNSKISNLKDHGLHPRWTHAVVNMLIMFGPLTLATYCLLLSQGLRYRIEGIGQNHLLLTSGTVVLFGLGFLSLAPHQEPRFLLPLLLPLVLLGEKPIQLYPTAGSIIWVVFNVILFVLFGILHQGGVVQSLLAVGSRADAWIQQGRPTVWIYSHTYMPPTFLTRRPRSNVIDPGICRDHQEDEVCYNMPMGIVGADIDFACQKDNVRLVDLNGFGFDTLWGTLLNELPCDSSDVDSNQSVYLTMPFLTEGEAMGGSNFVFSSTIHGGQCEIPDEKYKCDHVVSYGPHLTTEDFPPLGGSFDKLYGRMVLNVYVVSCSNMRGNVN